jgi:phosphoglycolate phosphatase
MRFPAILFDLDGTLLDTLEDIAVAANAALAQAGHPQQDVEAYRYFVGEGVQVLFSRALPPDARTPEMIRQCADVFREVYRKQWDVHTRPYPGIAELLKELVKRSVRMAVLSNKPHEATVRCIEKMLGEFPFEVVLGQRDGTPRKPDPAGAWEIADAMQLPPASFAFLGDTATDMQTAVRANMYPLGVLWGFRPREELLQHGAKSLIAQPRELLDVLE